MPDPHRFDWVSSPGGVFISEKVRARVIIPGKWPFNYVIDTEKSLLELAVNLDTADKLLFNE